jgi:CDP-diacylglycerol--inositol 3-phosphatidyltransferase
MLDDAPVAGVCYFMSGFLDHFDGAAARKYAQCSQFGATLDMVTDRVATTLLVRTALLLHVSHQR